MRRPLDEAPTVIGLAGDWHADSTWARKALTHFAEHAINTVFQLGDLTGDPGPRSRQFVSELEGACRHHAITIYLTPGNHEDHPRILALPTDETGLAWLTDHVAVLPRGHRWTMAGTTFVSLGGAPSVDYPSRIEGRTWFPQEAMTDNDVQQVAAGGHADIMLTHDAPEPGTSAVQRIITDHTGAWTRKGLTYAAAGRNRLTRAFEAVRPRLLAHGHYHVVDEKIVHPEAWDHPCRILSLNNQNRPGNLALLDIENATRMHKHGSPDIQHRWLDAPGS